jgi:hypothetical protein
LRFVRLRSPRAVRRFLRAAERRASLDLLRFSTEDPCSAEEKASNMAPKIPRGTEFPP